jgi:ribosome biogenesis protein MAK21
VLRSSCLLLSRIACHCVSLQAHGKRLNGVALQAAKADVSTKRAAAFLKRLLQVALHQAPNAAAAALLAASELLKAKPALWPALTQPEDSFAAEARDAPDEPSSDDADADPGEAAANGCRAVTLSTDAGTAAEERSGGATGWAAEAWPPEGYYDMAKRAPQHARAERACCWEAAPLARHAHPSVAAFAQALLAGASVVYAGDPLQDLTLLAFLDKFVKRCVPASQAGACCVKPNVNLRLVSHSYFLLLNALVT